LDADNKDGRVISISNKEGIFFSVCPTEAALDVDDSMDVIGKSPVKWKKKIPLIYNNREPTMKNIKYVCK
jgi:hypothetical protein